MWYFDFHVSKPKPRPKYSIQYEVLFGFYIFLKQHLPPLKKIYHYSCFIIKDGN